MKINKEQEVKTEIHKKKTGKIHKKNETKIDRTEIDRISSQKGIYYKHADKWNIRIIAIMQHGLQNVLYKNVERKTRKHRKA